MFWSKTIGRHTLKEKKQLFCTLTCCHSRLDIRLAQSQGCLSLKEIQWNLNAESHGNMADKQVQHAATDVQEGAYAYQYIVCRKHPHISSSGTVMQWTMLQYIHSILETYVFFSVTLCCNNEIKVHISCHVAN